MTEPLIISIILQLLTSIGEPLLEAEISVLCSSACMKPAEEHGKTSVVSSRIQSYCEEKNHTMFI